MPDPIDEERLAAFLDGRLPAEQRDELLAHLAADGEGEAYQVLVDAAATLRELEEEDGEPGAARRRSRALRAIRGEPLRALFTAVATAAARVRRWMDSGRRRN